MNSYESFTARDAAYFKPLLPLIRAERRRGLFATYFGITALYENQIVLGRCAYLEDLHNGPLDAQSLAARLSSAKTVPLDTNARVTFSPGNRRKQRACFRIDGSKRVTFRVPNYEVEHLLSFLQVQLGERLVVRNRVAFNGSGLLLLGLLMLALTLLSLWSGGEARYVAIPLGMLAGTLLAVFFYDQRAASPPWIRVEKKKKVLKDLSGRQPIRWPLLGLLLKLICAAVLIISILFGMFGVFDALVLLPINLVAVLGLYCGHLLSQRRPEYVRAGDSRPPILYLRSFLDDRKQTLVAMTRWAAVAGVLPPSYLPSPWNYVLRFNPARVLRVLLNRCVDTSEEQIGLFLRQFGPFVAIGQPGEWFADPGAARMYVTNEEWQGVVDSHLTESKYIVVQPASTEGVWWEVERVLKNVPLHKVLFCMVNFHLRQNDYESFQLRVKPLLAQSLPVGGGLTTSPAFMFFNSAAAPRLVPTSYSSPVLWPWLGNAVDLATTLKSFLTPAAAEKLPVCPQRPQGMSAISHFMANCAYFGVLMLAPMVVQLTLLIPAVQIAREAAKKKEQEKQAVAATAFAETDQPALADNAASTDLRPAPTAIDEMLKDADELFAKSDLPALDELTARMIALEPNHALARADRGLYLKLTNRPAEALSEFEKGTQLDAKNPMLWGLLGQTQIELKQFADAEASFSKAIELTPDQASFHFNRGFAYFEQQKYELAAVDFARAVDLKLPNPAEACLKCGLSLQRSGKVLASLRYFNTAEQLEPTNADYKLLRARAFEALGNHQFKDGNASEYARAGFEAVLKLVPQSATARFGRAMALQRLGQHSEAIADFDVLLQAEPANDLILWRRGFSHLHVGHYIAASADLQAAAQLDPKDDSAPELLIRIRVAQGNLNEALRLCDERLQATPNQMDLLVRKAIILFLADRADDANTLRDTLTPQLIDNPRLTVVILGAMLALQSDRNPELIKRAIAKAEQLAAANPKVSMLGLLAVALRIRLQDYAAADTALRSIDASTLTELPLAFHQLCQAAIAAHSAKQQTPDAATTAPNLWFEQNCPTKFEEGQPETLNGDWTSRVMLGKFYRDLLPTIARMRRIEYLNKKETERTKKPDADLELETLNSNSESRVRVGIPSFAPFPFCPVLYFLIQNV